MENIIYRKPDDCMVFVQNESVQRIKKAAVSQRLTTNRLAIRSGVERHIIEGLYYGKHRIRLSHLKLLCDVIFGDNSTYYLQEGSSNDVNDGQGE